MMPVSATPETQPHAAPGTRPRASVQRRGERVPGPVSRARGQNAQERYSSSSAATSKDPPAQPCPPACSQEVPATKSTLVEHRLPRPDPRGRVGEHDLGFLKKSGFKSQVF